MKSNAIKLLIIAKKKIKLNFFKTPGRIVKKCYEMIPNVKTILDPCAGDCGLEDN